MDKTTLQPFYESLMEFLALSKQQMFRTAADYDLTATQTMLLMLTPREDGRAMHAYCSLLGCDASNITGIVDGLERKRLLERAEHPSDRRVKTLRLLPEGAKIREALMRQMSDRNTSYILSKLSKDEIHQFTTLIQKITAGVCPAGAKTAEK